MKYIHIRDEVDSPLLRPIKSARSKRILGPACFLLLFCPLFSSGLLHAQDYVTFFRGDEVGPRSLDLDEESFLNLLSFEQPLESIQPWLAARSGYRMALGSMTSRDLWLDQELKHTVVISDVFRVHALGRQAVDFDSDHVFIQPTMEFQLNQRFEFLVPINITADKGEMDGGLGFRFRDQEAGVDYMQLLWTRADFMFEERSSEFRKSTVRDPADGLELQVQSDVFDLGKASLKIAYLTHTETKFEELGKFEEFRRFSTWLLHRYDLDDLNRIFFEFRSESADEEVTPFTPASLTDAFDGNRDAGRARLEYQRNLDEEGTRRFRGGIQHVRFREDENAPADPVNIHSIRRRESIFYGGYRFPLGQSEKVSLETMVYLDWLNNRNDYPNNPGEDGHDPSFQGKVNFNFLWKISEKVEFSIDPSFELDTFGWGGGGIQVRCLF